MPGRPRKIKSEKRGERLTINLTPGEITEIAAMAKSPGREMTVSDYVREKLFENRRHPETVQSHQETTRQPPAAVDPTAVSLQQLMETLKTKTTGADVLERVLDKLAVMEDLLITIGTTQAALLESQKARMRR